MDNPESINNQTQEQQDDIADSVRSDRAQLDPEMADALTRLYWERRIHYQLGYYQKKVRDFEDNVDNAFLLGAILMSLASFLAALGVIVQSISSLSALLALATAMIPAVASYITSFRQLYNWDRQLTIYRDTQLNLERSKMLLPDLDSLTPEDSHKIFPQLVQEVEGVLEKEAAQWGQVATSKEEEGAATAEFAETYGAALTDSSGEIDQRKLDALSGILESLDGAPDAGQYRLNPDELITDSPLLPDEFYGYSEEEILERRERAKAAAQAASQQVPAVDNSVEAHSLPPSIAEEDTSYSEPDISMETTETSEDYTEAETPTVEDDLADNTSESPENDSSDDYSAG